MNPACPVQIYVETVIGKYDAYNRAVLEVPEKNYRHTFDTPHEFFTFQLEFAEACHTVWPELPIFAESIREARAGLETFPPGEKWSPL